MSSDPSSDIEQAPEPFSNHINFSVRALVEMPVDSLLGPNFPLFDAEFQYPTIERQTLDPDQPGRQVDVFSAGEWDEMVDLVWSDDTGDDTGTGDLIVLSATEAWALMMVLNQWFLGRKAMPDDDD